MFERLSNRQIHNFLRNHPQSKPVFLACVPADAIPTSDIFPYALVVNTGNTGSKGIHWVAFVVTSPDHVEYFDPLGKVPEDHIKDYYEQFTFRKRMDYPLQSLFTNACGQFCLYFILRRCGGLSFESIVDSLKLHRCPDSLVSQWFERLRHYAR